jgi:hypothetical protein
LAEIADLGDLLARRARLADLLELVNDGDDCLSCRASVHRVHARRHVLEAFVADRLASTVAVVVPSPATSEVFDATSSPSARHVLELVLELDLLATDTPSLVIVGAPKCARARRCGRAERHLHGIREHVDADHHPVASGLAEARLLLPLEFSWVA